MQLHVCRSGATDLKVVVKNRQIVFKSKIYIDPHSEKVRGVKILKVVTFLA